MITHYGYEDGSGKYYVSIDAEKCNACGACIEKCPEKILTIDAVFIDLEDKPVAVVHEMQRKKIRYTCAACHEGKVLFCEQACDKGAIAAAWEMK